MNGHYEPVTEWIEDDDEFDDFDPEEAEEREIERLSHCWCGAWQMSERGLIHVADCVCGVE